MEITTESPIPVLDTPKASFQEGYLPVPLNCVPPESLNGLKIYLHTPPAYSLYKSTDLQFNRRDYDRLINAGVDYVYIGTHDHQAYYSAIESALDDILDNRRIITEKKSEILYSTTIALANQLLSKSPGAKEVKQTHHLTQSTVQFVIKNPQAFSHLFNISNHDFYTATHMTNVSTLMIAFAENIGIDDITMLNELGTGALLHDIGKMFIPQDLLNCKERLTPEQIKVIQSHVTKGVEHLNNIPEISETMMQVVSEHHEKCNGSGYPHALQEQDISIAGKIATVVDCFEAMISVRPYRDHSMSSDEALEIIQSMVPDSFDAEIVNAFSSFVETNIHGQPQDPNQTKSNLRILKHLGLNQSSQDPSGRKYPRFYFRVRSKLYRLRQQNNTWTLGNEEQVVVHNISQSGIGILSTRPLKKDTCVRISINSPQLPEKKDFIARVVRCINHADGWFTVGLQFISLQTDDQIKHIHNSLR